MVPNGASAAPALDNTVEPSISGGMSPPAATARPSTPAATAAIAGPSGTVSLKTARLSKTGTIVGSAGRGSRAISPGSSAVGNRRDWGETAAGCLKVRNGA